MNEIVHLRSGAACAHLLPGAGGRVSRLQLVAEGGAPVELLHPYPEDYFDPVRWGKGGIYPLLPYSNRIGQARVRVQGEEVRLQPHPDGLPHTLHGNAHRLAWTLEKHAGDTAVVVLDAPPSTEWPWHYSGRLELTLRPSSLRMQVTLRNAGMAVMPAGIGLHPYFRHDPRGLLQYQASQVWPATPDFLASSARAPLAEELHQTPCPLPPGGLTRYAGGWDGRADVDLPDGARLRIAADPVFAHLVVHRPDNLAYLCLEPVSHVADGFNLAARGVAGTGTRLLAPGESLGGAMTFTLLQGATAP